MFSLCLRPKSYLFKRSNLKSINVVREFDQLLMATCSRLTTRWSCYKTPGLRCWSSTTCTTGCITTCLTRLNCRTDRWTNLRILKLSWNRGRWKCRHCFWLKQDFPFCLKTHPGENLWLCFCVLQKFELLSLALLGVPSMAEKFLEISDNLKQLCFDSADYVCLKFILLLNAGKRKGTSSQIVLQMMKYHEGSQQLNAPCAQFQIIFWNLSFSRRGAESKQQAARARVQWAGKAIIFKNEQKILENLNRNCENYWLSSQVHQILLEYCQTCYPNVPVSKTFPLAIVMRMIVTPVVMPMHMVGIRVKSMNFLVTIMRGSLLQVSINLFLFSFCWDFIQKSNGHRIPFLLYLKS